MGLFRYKLGSKTAAIHRRCRIKSLHFLALFVAIALIFISLYALLIVLASGFVIFFTTPLSEQIWRNQVNVNKDWNVQASFFLQLGGLGKNSAENNLSDEDQSFLDTLNNRLTLLRAKGNFDRSEIDQQIIGLLENRDVREQKRRIRRSNQSLNRVYHSKGFTSFWRDTGRIKRDVQQQQQQEYTVKQSKEAQCKRYND